MNSLFEPTFDPRVPGPTPPSSRVASWYTPGHTDALGDRLLMSDTGSTSSLELLRFRPRLCLVRGFERALRARVERQKFFRHAAFSVIRSVEYLERQRGLTLVSVHTPGRRLSEIFDGPLAGKGVHPRLAGWLIRQLVPALADLQTQGAAAHGVLTADRIVLTPECTPVLIEHVLGPAVEQLYLPPARLWSEFGLIAPTVTGIPRFDSRSDVVHLGLIVLGLLLGRRVTPAEYPSRLDDLLDECSMQVARRSPSLVAPLRTWLERALRVEGALYESAAHARQDIAALPDDADPDVVGLLSGSDAVGGDFLLPELDAGGDALGQPVEAHPPAPPLKPDVPLEPVRVEPALAPRMFESVAGGASETDPARPVITVTPVLAVACAALVLVVLAQSVAIVRLLNLQTWASQASTASGGREGLTTGPPAPAPPTIAREQKNGPTKGLENAGKARAETPAAPVAAAVAAGRTRSGLRISSPIPLSALEGDRVLGSSVDGPIVTTPGVHEIDLINDTLGFREHRSVTVKAGEIVALKITPPQGQLSVDASPWAQVWLDGRPLGRTPITRVAVTLGEHYVTFRNPDLGESRRTVVVRSGDESRVRAAFGQ